jgi:8-oxo-dGTP diphosphatase
MSERFKMVAAVYALLRKDDQVLLLHRANTGYQDGKFGLVSGHMDGGELATEAMIREAHEEAGIVVNPADIRLVHITHKVISEPDAADERLELFFEIKKWTGEIINTEPEKCSELTWFPIANLPGDTIPFVKHVISEIEEGNIFSEYDREIV